MRTRKRVSSQQQQELISRPQVKEFLTSKGYIVSDIEPDLGEDFLVRIFDNGKDSGLAFYIQLKSTSNVKSKLLKSGNISFPFEVKDIEHWRYKAIPVLLLIWDVNEKQGWYAWVDDVLKQLGNNENWEQQEKVNVHFQKSNQLDDDQLLLIRYKLANIFVSTQLKDSDFIVKSRFSFPNSDDGISCLSELQNFFAKGKPCEIKGEFISEFSLPEIFYDYYGDSIKKIKQLSLTTKRSDNYTPFKLEFISTNYLEEFPLIKLWTIRQGYEEIELSNDLQEIPIKFMIILNDTNHSFTISIKSCFENFKGPYPLQFIKIQRIIALGCQIKLTNFDNSHILSLQIPPNIIQAPPEEFIEFIENIDYINSRLGIEIVLPEEIILRRIDIFAMKKLISVIKSGTFYQSNMIFRMRFSKSGVEQIIALGKQVTPIDLMIKRPDSFINLLSQEVQLGPMKQRIKVSFINNYDEMVNWCNHAEESEFFELIMPDVEVFEEFENWHKDPVSSQSESTDIV